MKPRLKRILTKLARRRGRRADPYMAPLKRSVPRVPSHMGDVPLPQRVRKSMRTPGATVRARPTTTKARVASQSKNRLANLLRRGFKRFIKRKARVAA